MSGRADLRWLVGPTLLRRVADVRRTYRAPNDKGPTVSSRAADVRASVDQCGIDADACARVG